MAEPHPDEPEAYPVAFSYGTSEVPGTAIATHVVFTGADYSGRPGNYFVHALVTGTPEQDFGSLLPVELWGSGCGTAARPTAPNAAAARPPARGVIDRPGTQAFLDAHGAGDVLPELLTAVSRAMAGEPPVLVAGHDVTENAWWIAAVCYLLGEHLGRRMTFTTYSHRPSYARYHLIGVLPGMVPPDAGTGFQLFDLAAGQTPDGGVHPLAALLANTGVMATAGLWHRRRSSRRGRRKTWTTGWRRSRWRRACSAGRCPPARPTPWPGGCPPRPGGCRPRSPTSGSASRSPSPRTRWRTAGSWACWTWPGGCPPRPGPTTWNAC